ncbi:MAG: TonB-dependent receptor [Verrucomicrobia bacterium]|nr:TonB-dependent receptor [Verrucomicrobiota bacterium]
MIPHPFLRESVRHLAFTLLLFAGGHAVAGEAAPAGRGAPATGAVIGRVLNTTSGNYLNNARVAVEGTNLEAYTDENGDYQLAAVPAGTARLVATFTGLGTRALSVVVPAGGSVRGDFELALPTAAGDPASDIVKLGAFTVRERELTGQAVALHEQRAAPNIKNVVAIDVDTGEGNVGEFLKYIPGIVMEQSPQTPQFANIRGMPASGTLVTTNGMEIAANGIVGRATDLGLSATGNIDRIEVTKVPTPDMPANAVGGGINMITKSGFSRKTPLLTYNLYATLSTLDGLSGPGKVFSRSAGPDDRSDQPRVNPSFNLSYLHPLNRSLAVALSLSRSSRYNDWDFPNTAWDKVGLKLTSNTINALPLGEDKELAAVTVDWRPLDRHALSLGYSFSNQEIFVRQNRVISTFGTGSTGGPTFAQGAATAVGNVAQSHVWNNQYKDLQLATLTYRYSGRRWRIDANAAHSIAGTKFTDMEDGFFNTAVARLSNVIIRHEGIDQSVNRRVPFMTVTDRTGAIVDGNDLDQLTLVSAGSAAQDVDDRVARAAVNVSRELDLRFGLTLKAGAMINRRTNEVVGGSKSWTITPPTGTSALVRNYDLQATRFSTVNWFRDPANRVVPVRWLSSAKLYDLYQAHPTWFVLNESAAHTNQVNATKTIEETITAAYLRSDWKFFDNRLWLVAGARYERTDDEGWGPLNDIRATYRQDANGNLLRDAAGRLIPVTTNALERTKLQYILKGAHTKRDYDGVYPSVNASYSLTPNLVARAAYAKTIGRPNFPEIIPGMTITDPDATTLNKTITIVNSGLQPWSADNFDLSLEAYEVRGAVASVSLFQKDLKNFFGSTRTDATIEELASFGLSEDYLDYDIITKRNVGNATIRGVEFSYRQSLGPVVPWLRGFQVYTNVTLMDLGGPNAEDLTGFSPRTVQWGVSYTRPKFSARVNVNQNKWRRAAPATASATVRPGSYTYFAPQVKIDATVSYMFSRRYSVYADVRNLMGTAQRRGVYSPDTPVYARIDLAQYPAAAFTLGLKGEF